jgi:hypothetical protein
MEAGGGRVSKPGHEPFHPLLIGGAKHQRLNKPGYFKLNVAG